VADVGTPTETVGFVGLGVMGAPMARHLLDAGMALVVHNRSSGPAEALRELGASVASSRRVRAWSSRCFPTQPM
jgi:3-hydroxyisobutyrate dehydrogenase-like beta-hydroxyacid dehydrogenase